MKTEFLKTYFECRINKNALLQTVLPTGKCHIFYIHYRYIKLFSFSIFISQGIWWRQETFDDFHDETEHIFTEKRRCC